MAVEKLDQTKGDNCKDLLDVGRYRKMVERHGVVFGGVCSVKVTSADDSEACWPAAQSETYRERRLGSSTTYGSLTQTTKL